jgi:hypothetical protein
MGQKLFGMQRGKYMQFLGINGRSALMCLCYQKQLRLTGSTNKAFSTAKVTNIVSGDVLQFEYLNWAIGDILLLPIILSFAFYNLYQMIGLSFVSGIGFLFLQLGL